MAGTDLTKAAAEETSRRLFVYNGGFLTQGRVRRILELSGYDIRLGKPGAEGDMVGVWGQSPTSPRGEAVADWTDTPILRVEDAFLRSVRPGREGGEPPIGLHLDRSGVHFDPATISDLERLLLDHPLDDTVLLNRARAAMERLRAAHLSKYSAFDPATPAPEPGYVVVIDQTKGDASVKASRGDRNRFLEMLFDAQEENPGRRVLVKVHPETAAGAREGYFRPEDMTGTAEWFDQPISPYTLFDGAVAVYTVSSQMGFDAVLAGHNPHVYGQPFYMGWGLTQDRIPLARRQQRRLTRAQLFAAAMILYPVWYDPWRDRLGTLETAIDALEAEARAWREDHRGWVATGMRLWKRKPLQGFFGDVTPVLFDDRAPLVRSKDKRLMVWAGKATAELATAGAVRVEDGFLRSRGLGAELIPPLSLVLDDLGIYYDPTAESRLERLVNAAERLSDPQRLRAERLIARLVKSGLSKYNLPPAPLPPGLPGGRRILVPGQVEDDASIRLGAGEVRTNLALLQAARAANPAATLIYKPHPDVLAGLRPGAAEVNGLADLVLTDVDAISAIAAVDEVWTMTSTLGFEALLRDKRVVTLGQPFYAGWGLTEDRGASLPRRQARPGLAGFVHATLIDYPRYRDPVTGRPCPVEVIVERLEKGEIPLPGRGNRILSKLQGVFASFASLWR